MKGLDSILVSLGGLFGTASRYGVFSLIPEQLAIYGTFLVNIMGSFMIGLIFEFVKERTTYKRLWLLVGTGFCGGFTTMSTFAFDFISLWQNHQFAMGFMYIIITWVLGIGLTLQGMRVAKKIPLHKRSC